MKQYCRVILGKSHSFAAECREKDYVGVDFDIEGDLTGRFPEDWRDFNKEFIPKLIQSFPNKSKISAGLACGMTWTLCKGLNVGDIVLSPTGDKTFYVGKISGPYQYSKVASLPHQRPVAWLGTIVDLSDMSEQLRNAIGSIGTTCMLNNHAGEIELLISDTPQASLTASTQTMESVSEFVLEKHLEEFIVKNWDRTPFSQNYEIYKNEKGETTGQQYESFERDKIDILAISKDKKTLLVIELKKGRGTDEVLGQVLRYMGYINTLKEEGQVVKGLIIAHEDDPRIRHALSMVKNVDFYAYKIQFSLTQIH